jgi:hypothetical protein
MATSVNTIMNSNVDPGRGMRWLAWCGAALCVVSTFLPIDHKTIWGASDEIVRIAYSNDRNESMLIVAFCCLAAPMLLCGPVFAFACTPRGCDPKAHIRRWTVTVLWAATAISPYYFILRHLPQRLPENENFIVIAISVLSVYLLLNGLAFLRSRRERGTPLTVFSLGLIPICAGELSWLALCGAVVEYVYFRSGRVDRMTIVTAVSGAVASLLLLIGWLGWWRAVSRDHRAKIQAQRTAAMAQPTLATNR